VGAPQAGVELLLERLGTEPLEQVFKRAENGSPDDAHDVLAALAAFLGTEGNRHPLTGELLPVPSYMRDYLARAFARMAAGVKPDQALNLKRSGKNKWTHQHKLMAVSIVAQFIASGSTVNNACEEAADAIQAYCKAMDSKTQVPDNVEIMSRATIPKAWSNFSRGKPRAEQLRNWYYELKQTVDSILAIQK
jgi:hypothetical protein